MINFDLSNLLINIKFIFFNLLINNWLNLIKNILSLDEFNQKEIRIDTTISTLKSELYNQCSNSLESVFKSPMIRLGNPNPLSLKTRDMQLV